MVFSHLVSHQSRIFAERARDLGHGSKWVIMSQPVVHLCEDEQGPAGPCVIAYVQCRNPCNLQQLHHTAGCDIKKII